MAERLPPLTALRAFDAAARHLSFAKAADELGVTPAALSFQIKSLEAHLGQPVFRRLNRAVALTAAGRALAPGTREGFLALATAWRAAGAMADIHRVTVTAGPAFTAKWLAPRLSDFARAHPKIELRFAASLRRMDLLRDEVDVAIRFGFPGGDGDGPDARPLLDEWMTPMMAPALAARLTRPGDLVRATLLHQDDVRFLDPPADWAAWLRAEGLGAPAAGGPRFSHADHAIDAAIAGAGVVLGRITLAAGDLDAGRLVAPFATALALPVGYRLLLAPGALSRPAVARFADWAAAEARGATARIAGRRLVAL